MKTIYNIEFTSTGYLIDTTDTLEFAEQIVADLEKEDEENNDFEENFYSIYKIEGGERYLHLYNGKYEKI